MTRKLGYEYKTARAAAEIVELFPFSSESKKMATIVKNSSKTFDESLEAEGRNILYTKGASEIILRDCSKFVDANGKIQPIDATMRAFLGKKIETYAKEALRTLCVAFKPLVVDFPQKPSVILKVEAEDSPESYAYEESSYDMILLGIFGIQDPVRPEVPIAVLACQKAGIVVRMVTGDNAETARAIAQQCGILTKGGIVIEGPEFRILDIDSMDALVPKLQVMARSSPLDKQILVQCLKRLGETVAVTGDGTNDAPALKSADVGFSMGIAGTEVAKEASDIVLLDDNFASLVKAVVWGRSVYDSVRKFLQFQLTVNITAVVVTLLTSLISTVASPTNTPISALSAIQLLWVNLIMNTFAALALATDKPNEFLLERKPAKKTAPLINKDMWKQIIGQAFYQIIVCFILFLRSDIIMGRTEIDPRTGADKFANAIVFNTFVFCQLFNEWNCRSISRDINIFRGVLQNRIFLCVVIFSVTLQVLIVEFGGYTFHTMPIGWKSWLICIAFGFGSIPVGFFIRLIPDNRQVAEIRDMTEHEIQHEILDLHRVVIDMVEATNGRSLSVAEKSVWLNAIQRSSAKLEALGHHQSKGLFRDGILVGCQMSITATSNRSVSLTSINLEPRS